MKLFDKNTHLLLRMFCGGTERETLDYVVNGTRKILGDTAPGREAVKAFLSNPDTDDQFSTGQRVVVIDQLLECLEVNIRTTFDLIRYKAMKEAGIVRNMDLRYGKEHCSSHVIREELLDQLIIDELRRTKRMYQQNWDGLQIQN